MTEKSKKMISISVITVLAAVLGVITSVFTIDARYAKAEQVFELEHDVYQSMLDLRIESAVNEQDELLLKQEYRELRPYEKRRLEQIDKELDRLYERKEMP